MSRQQGVEEAKVAVLEAILSVLTEVRDELRFIRQSLPNTPTQLRQPAKGARTNPKEN